ncbi:hypothetical protein BKA67DRAFT_596360 [Truncatella angustata]|uniref:Uncharacterized protein n=1 Tax=Truncatella angustata TaxID=152316 RepID=A0A9P8UBB5_9PEZI|nr:uncharacterized protein BKA67DRAFT_596360 [Truncatella angustata]KAH6638559.1 hypothetical protein BKA67DRAFT_596360 [Truncatella angustata]
MWTSTNSPPFPSPTATWHNDTYPSISPSRPELSAAGKTVVITGAGSGIGRETAIAYATAGAASIVLLGRHVSKKVFSVDVTEKDALQRVASAIGSWDVLILAAGHVSDPSPIASASTDSWWQDFETNVKATFLGIMVFLPTKNESNATVLALTSGAVALPSSLQTGLSAYASSKLAQIKLIDFLASDGANANALPIDQVQLPAHFLVWMSSSEATFLKGRSVWANWDVDELKAQAKEIKSGVQMTAGINGWPYHADS